MVTRDDGRLAVGRVGAIFEQVSAVVLRNSFFFSFSNTPKTIKCGDKVVMN